MKKITPSAALIKIENFISRIDRLERNKYSNKRFRTSDLNKLKLEFNKMYLFYSIAIFNKNSEKLNKILPKYKDAYIKAYKIIESL